LTTDNALYRFRLRVFALATEMGNVRAACRIMGIHPSTYYRWRAGTVRWGLEGLRPRERRPPRMPNSTSPMVEQRILAFALGHPGFGPDRIAAELARKQWGGIKLSPNGVWRVLKRHGLNTRAKRLGLIAGYAAVHEPVPSKPAPERHIHADHPGELVQFDCFKIGRLHRTDGILWQYTAIDVASSYCWAELWVTPRNPACRYTSLLVHRVATELARRGWRLEAVSTDGGSEFAGEFLSTLDQLDVRHVRIPAGRPQSNGCVERVQGTILEECWKPAFARHMVPAYTRLRDDLRRYLVYYNTDSAHTGRKTKGRTPDSVLGKAKMVTCS
jgi:transposase InsO family protein